MEPGTSKGEDTTPLFSLTRALLALALPRVATVLDILIYHFLILPFLSGANKWTVPYRFGNDSDIVSGFNYDFESPVLVQPVFLSVGVVAKLSSPYYK